MKLTFFFPLSLFSMETQLYRQSNKFQVRLHPVMKEKICLFADFTGDLWTFVSMRKKKKICPINGNLFLFILYSSWRKETVQSHAPFFTIDHSKRDLKTHSKESNRSREQIQRTSMLSCRVRCLFPRREKKNFFFKERFTVLIKTTHQIFHHLIDVRWWKWNFRSFQCITKLFVSDNWNSSMNFFIWMENIEQCSTVFITVNLNRIQKIVRIIIASVSNDSQETFQCWLMREEFFYSWHSTRTYC